MKKTEQSNGEQVGWYDMYVLISQDSRMKREWLNEERERFK